MPAKKLEVPEELNRNARRAKELGPEETGARILANIAKVLGLSDLAEVDLLDVGCGVRFTQAILNRDIAIRSYTGVDVAPNVIEWLRGNVRDPRFRYALWNVRNAMYNKRGVPFTRASKLPVDGRFGLVCLYSVFTHLDPSDADAMLHVLRGHVRPDGKLLFTVFLDDAVGEFEDRKPDRPLNVAVYSLKYMTELLTKNGWKLERSIPRQKELLVQHQLLCSPV